MTQKQKTTIIYALPALLLCIPVIGNLISKEFDWSASDFGIAAVLLFGTAFLIDFIQRIIKNKTYKILFCAGLVLMLLLIWAELAVGLFGTPFAGN